MTEHPDYLSKQLITYLGNKRALLRGITQALDRVVARTGQTQLRLWDAFSGSGVVSRLFKSRASLLISSDLEDYAAVVGRCFLRNANTVAHTALVSMIEDLNTRVQEATGVNGFLEELYAPQDEANITTTDRVFYTTANARRLDWYRQAIDTLPVDCKYLLLGPLLSQASVHTNTAGVFKGFYKNRQTKRGQFGGTGTDALTRIRGTILLEEPILSVFDCDCEILQGDANTLVKNLRNLDLAYFDPPYNQHPYGSNYFMLNLLVNYQRPEQMSRVSGIPTDWRRSGYNKRAHSAELFQQLLQSVDAKFVLVSFNDEGFISPKEMQRMLEELGTVEVFETPYNTFRGSRNLRGRAIHVTEQLFLVEKK